jgi:hypothetical protein
MLDGSCAAFEIGLSGGRKRHQGAIVANLVPRLLGFRSLQFGYFYDSVDGSTRNDCDGMKKVRT